MADNRKLAAGLRNLPASAREDLAGREQDIQRGKTVELLRRAGKEMYENPIVNTALSALPVSGELMSAGDIAEEFGQGNYKTAGLYTLLATAPFGSKGIKALKALKEAPYEKALREAEEYGQKMLGLPPGNTPMDRAMAGGYVEPNYHGALDASQNVLIPSKGGELGQGSYVTRSPELASEFARKQYGAPYQEGSGVFPLLTRKLEEIPRNQWVDTRLEEMNRLRSENKGEWSPEFYEQSMENMRKKTENAGNYGWYTPGEGGVNQGVVFDTGNMRSRFAAFDPRYFGKPGLMLGASGLGVYGALQGEDEYK